MTMDDEELVQDGYKISLRLKGEFEQMLRELGMPRKKSERIRHLIERDVRRHKKMKRLKEETMRGAS